MKRDCKGLWVPIEVWEAKDLSWSEKILFIEIDSFTSKEKECFISNEYIAKLLNVTETTANKVLSSLIKKGYVIKTRFDGRRRFVRTGITLTKEQSCPPEQSRVAPESKAGLRNATTQNCASGQSRVAQNGNILNTVTSSSFTSNTLNIKESILTNTKENATNVATTQPPQQEIFSVPPQVETLPAIPPQEERKEKVARKRKESFVAPTVEQVRAYCRERGNTVDADKFCDYYTSVGWKVGRNPMKDWQSAVRTWERTNKNYNNENTRGVNNTRKSEEQERAERDQYIFEKYLKPRLEGCTITDIDVTGIF